MKTNEITLNKISKHIKYEFYDQVGSQVGYQACDQVGNHVEDQISYKIMEIEDAVTRNDFIWEVQYEMNLIL